MKSTFTTWASWIIPHAILMKLMMRFQGHEATIYEGSQEYKVILHQLQRDSHNTVVWLAVRRDYDSRLQAERKRKKQTRKGWKQRIKNWVANW